MTPATGSKGLGQLSAHRDPDLYVRKTDRYRVAEALARSLIQTI